MTSILLKLDPEKHEKLKEKKIKEGFKNWEDFIIAHILGESEDSIKQQKINELKARLYEDYLQAKTLSENNIQVLELLRVATVKLIDNDREKAKEFLTKALEVLSNG